MTQWIIPPKFPFRGVVFDMDGLMIDTERVIRYSWDVMGEKMGYVRFGDNIFQTLGMSRVQRNHYFLEKYGEDFPLQSFWTDIIRSMRRTRGRKGFPEKKDCWSC